MKNVAGAPGFLGRVAQFLDDPPDAAAVVRGEGTGELRWRRLAERANAHPQAVDFALVLLLGLISTAGLARHGHGTPIAWILEAALLVPLVWRRRYPAGVFAVLSAVALVQWFVAEPLVADLALLVALSTVAVHRPRRTALAAAAVLESGVIIATVRWTLNGSWIRSLVFLSAMVGAALLLGANIRARRAHLATLIERAERLEHERDQQALLAAVAERTRIAREMHDVLAHSLAVMVSLADGAAAKLTSEPERAAVAIGHVSDLGRQSLRDTRRLLGVLRADDSPELTMPQPDVAQLDDLMERVRSTGLDASLAVAGDPFEIPPGAGLTVYRIVQEALTNSLKHAAGAKAVQVRLSYEDPKLDVEVSDDGHAPPAPAQTRGHGLAGMRERASMYQGTVVAGPTADGGWKVQASLAVGPLSGA